MTLDTDGFELRRRELLIAATGLALLPSPVLAAGWRAAELAVGYLPTPVPGEDAVRAVAASRLSAGDPKLARTGVRVTVEGLIGDGSLGRRGLRSAELKVGFPVAGAERVDAGPSTVEYRAWSWQLSPLEQAGSAVRFTVPVDAGLALALEVEGWSWGSERFETVLVTGRDAGRPKLRPGRYLIAPGTAEFRSQRLDPSAGEPMIALRVESAPA